MGCCSCGCLWLPTTHNPAHSRHALPTDRDHPKVFLTFSFSLIFRYLSLPSPKIHHNHTDSFFFSFFYSLIISYTWSMFLVQTPTFSSPFPLPQPSQHVSLSPFFVSPTECISADCMRRGVRLSLEAGTTYGWPHWRRKITWCFGLEHIQI